MSSHPDDADRTITTSRLLLRPLRRGDETALWPYVSDDEISRYMSWHPHRSLDVTRAFIEDVVRRVGEGTNATWVLEQDGAVCGLVSLIAILRRHRALRYDKAELAYWLGAGFRGKGLATEACAAVLAHGFEKMALNKVTVAHVRENRASGDLIRRLGFRRVGVEKRHFEKDGRWYDHILYELLHSDWAAAQRSGRVSS